MVHFHSVSFVPSERGKSVWNRNPWKRMSMDASSCASTKYIGKCSLAVQNEGGFEAVLHYSSIKITGRRLRKKPRFSAAAGPQPGYPVAGTGCS